MLNVVIGDLSFKDYGFCLTERPSIPVAERAVTFYDGIDEIDGALTEYGSLKNRTFTLPVNILEDVPVKSVIRRFRGLLLDKYNAQFIFSDEPDIYYLVKSIKMGDIDNEITEKGEFDLEVTIDPFDYNVKGKSVEGQKTVTVVNEGTYKALPKITVTGTGTIVLKTNGDYPVTITDLNGSVVIDSEYFDYYNPNMPTLRTLKVSAKAFPELKVGTNTITTTGTVTKLKVEFKERFR